MDEIVEVFVDALRLGFVHGIRYIILCFISLYHHILKKYQIGLEWRCHFVPFTL